ncbi:hypothetical protein SNE40_012885 [Patella caerulea]|uniref:Uncharacterized protein n=2 Tax=Patella caerulea TaxID=87958 RepID=A0AAN8PMG9_PATCE
MKTLKEKMEEVRKKHTNSIEQGEVHSNNIMHESNTEMENKERRDEDTNQENKERVNATVNAERIEIMSSENSSAYKDGLIGVPKATKVVLSRVYADRSEDETMDNIWNHAKKRKVEISYIKVLKYRENFGSWPTYTLQLILYDVDLESVLNSNFWPDQILCRKWITRSGSGQQYSR